MLNPVSIAIVRHFKAKPFGHGGEKRSFQLETIINRIGESTAFVPPHPDKRPWLQQYQVLSTIERTFSERNYKLPYRQYKTVNYRSKNRMHEMVLSNPKLKESKVVVWESTIPEYEDFPKLVSSSGMKKVVACPHNIESLVEQPYYYWKQKHKMGRLGKEISYLKLCDEVFTISEEDQWLLQLFDINARYLPYYPEGIIIESLLKVRSLREKRIRDKCQTKQFLILGAAINPPTEKGMQMLLETISKEDLPGISFNVAGFGTERFSKYASDSVTINGSLSESELERQMVACDAIIINQGFSTGSLTKNIEFLVAGIPVICDEGSARSYQRFSGLYCYMSFQMLKALLVEEDLRVPSLPIKPSQYYKSFTDALSIIQ
jgi:hypothetical protein